MAQSGRSRIDHASLAVGLLIILLGAAFFLERLDYFDLREVWRFWPTVLIAVGLLQAVRPGNGRPSIFLLLMGVWLQISTLELWGLGWGDSWPLLIMFIGASLVFDATVGRAGLARTRDIPGASEGVDDAR